jgi:hypothetical protein
MFVTKLDEFAVLIQCPQLSSSVVLFYGFLFMVALLSNLFVAVMASNWVSRQDLILRRFIWMVSLRFSNIPANISGEGLLTTYIVLVRVYFFLRVWTASFAMFISLFIFNNELDSCHRTGVEVIIGEILISLYQEARLGQSIGFGPLIKVLHTSIGYLIQIEGMHTFHYSSCLSSEERSLLLEHSYTSWLQIDPMKAPWEKPKLRSMLAIWVAHVNLPSPWNPPLGFGDSEVRGSRGVVFSTSECTRILMKWLAVSVVCLFSTNMGGNLCRQLYIIIQLAIRMKPPFEKAPFWLLD